MYMFTARLFPAALAACVLVCLPGCGSEGTNDLEPVNPSYHELGNSPACGTTLTTWNGTSAHSNGQFTGTGTSCGGVGTYGYQYQCVELVMRHFSTNWGVSWKVGYAKYTLDQAPAGQVDVYKNGDTAHPPLPGDMLVWSNGIYGHVALVTQVTGSAVSVIEQNVKGNGQASFSYDGKTVGPRWSTWWPIGWAHAKANTSAPPIPKVSCKYYKQNPSGPGAYSIKAGQALKVEIDFTNRATSPGRTTR